MAPCADFAIILSDLGMINERHKRRLCGLSTRLNWLKKVLCLIMDVCKPVCTIAMS